jgi:nitroreductase
MTDAASVFNKIVSSRHSTRAYLPAEVPQAVLDKVFDIAQWAPSNCNTQPWPTHIASGDVRDKLAGAMSGALMEGKISMDFPYAGVYAGVYKERQYGAAQTLYAAVGIERGDKEGRQLQFMQNFNFFGAPHVAFIFMPEAFGLREACDVGMYAQTLMLAMTAHGLASCPQTALSFNADGVREILGVDSSEKLLFGISFGYPQVDADVNNALTDRSNLDQSTTFHR